jgi:cellulose synthase/poly-beta-1,6-N-acetylglucosamine synthase-like glycosyltransferase
MSSNYLFTYVIGYRHNIERLQNLRRVLDWINGFGGVEVLLIEQDTHSKIKHLNLKAKHIFTKSNMPYNRSWAFNVAMRYANSNIIVFGDSDLIMEPNQFITGLNSLNNYEMVSPYHSVVDLTQQESNMSLDQIININRPGRGETDNQKINISGGIAMFRRDAIQKIGGWNEDFIGWGGEDDFQTMKVKNFLTWTELKARCYHLYHSRVQPDTRWYQRNLQILQKSSTMNKEQLQKVIFNQMPKIGWKNKYDNF